MAITPQMKQSIQLLGMSIKDLSEYIDSLVTKNPFLQKLINNKKSDKYNGVPGLRADGETYDHADTTRYRENPRFSLLSNLRMLGLKDKALEITEYMIFEMDENGYITVEPEEVASDLGVTTEEVEDCLEAIQGMEPAGIGARDIRECLQLQLKRKNKQESLEYAIVSHFLIEVARNDIEKIANSLKVDKNKVRDAINYIKKLDPRPASAVLSKDTQVIIPELLAKVDKRAVRLELNKSHLPRLKIYNPYENELDIIKDPEARKFLKENMNIAKGLVDNLKRREDTICKVAKYILDFQKEAIAKGEAGLKTLTLKDVAEALNFHPSTISRAISNKYIQINDKVVPMNSLLSHGIKKESGELTSKSFIKNRIVELVKKEDGALPLSDAQIEAKLKENGIVIKRRTIAKYRKCLQILPTHLRKKVKAD